MQIKTVWIKPVVGFLSAGRCAAGLRSWRIAVSFFLCLLLAPFPESEGRLSGAIQGTAIARCGATSYKALTEGYSLGAAMNSGTAIWHGANPTVNPTDATPQSSDVRGCQGGWIPPIRVDGERGAPKPLRAFDRPAHNWLPGHRGVDLAAGQDADILAPETGMIIFAGEVAGKSVVSIRHGPKENLTSTFEPAVTHLHPGDRVERGTAWGSVHGHSDHCDDGCLHWGLRTKDREYVNPMSKLGRHRIALKPV